MEEYTSRFLDNKRESLFLMMLASDLGSYSGLNRGEKQTSRSAPQP